MSTRIIRVVCLLALLSVTHPVVAAAQTASPSASAGADVVSLRPGDRLQVAVWPDQTYGGEFIVEESGYVHLPFLGRVQAAGVSVEQLRVGIRVGLGEVMKEPVVTVTPLFRVGVMGAVERPGVYSVTPASNLFDVIGLAGGFSDEASEEGVRIVRQGSVIEVDAARQLRYGLAADDLVLRSGDQVVVPRSSGAGWGTVLDVLRTAATVGLLVDRVSN